MLTVRKANERGHARHGWLESYHTFSFAEYHDPRHMGFRDLRVINEDRVQGGQGFPNHSHRDMEILSYVIDGALEHRDSLGTGSVIRPGDVQKMSAGTGVTHSEYNAAADSLVHFLQIWIIPAKTDIAPGYEQKHFSAETRRGTLRLVASGDARADSIRVQQDADVYATLLASGQTVRHQLRRGRGLWLQLIGGAVEVNGTALAAGDGAAIEAEPEVEIAARDAAEALVFDLA